MASQAPTLGGAVGEAGIMALGQLRESQKEAFERDLAERTLAARSARDRISPSNIVSLRGDLGKELTELLANPVAMRTQAGQDRAASLEAQMADLDRVLGIGNTDGLDAVSPDYSEYALSSTSE
jgi:hypothetical protein